MDRHQHPLRPAGFSRGRLFAGLVLCALVVVFACAAKVSWYQQSTSPTHSISKMKAFKAEPQAHATTQAVVPLPLAVIPVVIALAALFLFEAGCTEPREKRPRKSNRGFVGTTAARPPPSR